MNSDFKSMRELSDSDILRKGDCIWRYGCWHPIPNNHLGYEVKVMKYIYGVDPRPTFGRKQL